VAQRDSRLKLRSERAAATHQRHEGLDGICMDDGRLVVGAFKHEAAQLRGSQPRAVAAQLATRDATSRDVDPSRDPACIVSSARRTLCSLPVLLVLVVRVCSGLPVLPVTVMLVLVLFLLAVLVLAVLAVLVVDGILLAEAVCAACGSGPTRASSSNVAAFEARARPAGEDIVSQNRTLVDKI
jgi:hypothetical protein